MTGAMEKNENKGESDPEESNRYPRSIFFILGNEFCERFCYYGMRTILTIYLSQELLYSENTATVVYHLFAMLAYFTPLVGAIIADTWLGKFKTILYVSIIYAIGNIILSVGAIPNDLNIMRTVTILGLIIIGMGTGGIKPCVSAFGGDQFHHHQQKQRERFFSVFYFMINCGSVFSTILTPILRADVKCFGNDSCFPVAFGVPAALMIVALILFIAGKRLYIIEEPKGNILTSVCGAIYTALSSKISNKGKKKDHWLDYAEDKYGKTLVADIKAVLHILVLYIPLPLFWALFDQTGSRWTIQATKLDGEVRGFHIKADQIQVINPFLILAFIPLFDYVIYPLLDKCRLLRKPLQRITVGGILAGISFVLAGFIELAIEGSAPTLPAAGYSELTVVNLSPCTINITQPGIRLLKTLESGEFNNLPLKTQEVKFDFTTVGECDLQPFSEETFNLTNSIESMIIGQRNQEFEILRNPDSKTKSEKGEARIRLFFSVDGDLPQNISFKLEGPYTYYLKPENMSQGMHIGMTNYTGVYPGKYKLFLPFNDTAYNNLEAGDLTLGSGGVYIANIYKHEENNPNISITAMVSPNTVPILYQVPQYVVLTAGEIMFSITGLEFSYSQAPLSMKSVLQAAWLLTVAFGNLIVFAIVYAIGNDRIKRSEELFMYAVLMGVDMFIFAILAYFYKYNKVKTYSENRKDDSGRTSTSNGKVNEGYVEETDFNKK